MAKQPARVPDAVIDGIREREIGGVVRLPKPRRFKPGDRVRVVRGPFEGHFGLYDGMAPRERIFVLLSMLGASIRTEALADICEPGPGDVDRAVRVALKGIWDPPLETAPPRWSRSR
jgi:transcription antitermination factor NusG